VAQQRIQSLSWEEKVFVDACLIAAAALGLTLLFFFPFVGIY
jgi:hypothetical protein